MTRDEANTTEPAVQIVRDSGGQVLPMVGQPRERADAAENRRRILAAAQVLANDRGASGLTMQAVATAAGVGKATVFHRFGDRDGLVRALLDDYMTELQDGFLHGPPPLGPGARADQRLEAFMSELVRCTVANLGAALIGESLDHLRSASGLRRAASARQPADRRDRPQPARRYARRLSAQRGRALGTGSLAERRATPT